MSLDMVNDVPDLMAVDPTDDSLFPFMDNIVSGKNTYSLFTVKDG